jgi:hypothetical protein
MMMLSKENVKWKEVMKFMRKNPLIMMDMMPPTPGKSRHSRYSTYK